MPIYEYECRECHHSLEKLQKLSDAPMLDCPACGKPALQKLVSAAGFRLKGGGWYATDFKHSGKQNASADKSAASTDKKPDSTEKKPQNSGNSTD